MNTVVVLKMVPDVVEELEIVASGDALDLDAVRMTLNESDDHALEEALLLKERVGGTVTVLALDAPEVDDALYTALAKGADRAIKVTGADEPVTTRMAAYLLRAVMAAEPGLLPADMVLTGTQAIDDLDGLMAPLLAHHLGWPYLGILTSVKVEDHTASVVKEYSGGVRGEFDISLPAVLGIQAAEKPPRYVPVAKVRAAMKARPLETAGVPTMAEAGPPLAEIRQMRKPQAASEAELIGGEPEEAAEKLCALFAGRGLL